MLDNNPDNLDRISFAEWLVALNEAAIKAGYICPLPFTRAIGQLEWFSAYTRGLSPQSALAQAAEDSLIFAPDYEDLV